MQCFSGNIFITSDHLLLKTSQMLHSVVEYRGSVTVNLNKNMDVISWQLEYFSSLHDLMKNHSLFFFGVIVTVNVKILEICVFPSYYALYPKLGVSIGDFQ